MYNENRNRRSPTDLYFKRLVRPSTKHLISPVPEADEDESMENDAMEGMYLKILNELIKEKALTNRRINQSKMRLL